MFKVLIMKSITLKSLDFFSYHENIFLKVWALT